MRSDALGDDVDDCRSCTYIDAGGGDRYVVVMCETCREANDQVIEAIIAARRTAAPPKRSKP